MTIHSYFGDYSSHANEVKMLDQFLSQLSLDWSGEDRWIYVIYNAMWNGNEIDMVCITPESIIAVDFKNYTGSLSGKENGEWLMQTASGQEIEVKGGGQINPFVQIRKNKYAIKEWLEANHLLFHQNTNHIAGLIIFSEVEKADLDISSNSRKWFNVTDIPHSSKALLRINSNDINLTEKDALDIVRVLNVKPYAWVPQPVRHPRFNPFPETERVGIGMPNDISYASRFRQSYTAPGYGEKNSFGRPEPEQPALTFSELRTPEYKSSLNRRVIVPILAMVIGCAALANHYVSSYYDKHSKQDRTKAIQAKKLVDQEDDLPYEKATVADTKNVLNTTDPKAKNYFNIDQLPDPYFDELPDPTHYVRGSTLNNLMQVIDDKSGKVYGFELGKTTYFEAQGKLTTFDHSDNSMTQPRKPSSTGFDRIKKIDVYHKDFPAIPLGWFLKVETTFDENNVVNSVNFLVGDTNYREMHRYIKRYKRLGYKLEQAQLFQQRSDQYAVLNKGDRYVAIVFHADSNKFRIYNTNKVTFDKNKTDILTPKTFI